MKKIKKLGAIALTTLLVGSSLAGVYAQENIKVKVDGKNINFTDAKPYKDENSRTLVPLFFVADALGASVQWDSDSWKVVIQKEGTKISLLIGSNRAELNGEIITMDTAPILSNERTMVPLAFISQCFGAEVNWDETTSTVSIKQQETPQVLENSSKEEKIKEETKEEMKTETPKTETPKTETPKTETPKTETPKTETPKTETPKTETPT